MPVSLRSYLTAGVAVVTTSALVFAPSASPAATHSVASPAIRLSAAAQPLMTSALVFAPSASPTALQAVAWPAILPSAAVQPLTASADNIPSLADQMRRGIVPSLGAPFPTPGTPEPSVAYTEFEDAIKNTYSAIEPWVRYGFEVATYAVGWIPWVGWLSPQIMIFYNFGERIVQSLVFNSADWLWGPLPLGQGLRNIAQDSWDALQQLGKDEWNFFLPPLPPLPPLPGGALVATTLATDLTSTQQQSHPTLAQGRPSLGQHLGLPDLPAPDIKGAVAANADGLITRVERSLGDVGTKSPAIRGAVKEAAESLRAAVRDELRSDVTSATDLDQTKTVDTNAVRRVPRKAAVVVDAARSALPATASSLRAAATDAPRGKGLRAAKASGNARQQSTATPSSNPSATRAGERAGAQHRRGDDGAKAAKPAQKRSERGR